MTTSWRDPRMFSLPGIDIVQAHSYWGSEYDTAEYSVQDTNHLMRPFGKPFFFGEQGVEDPGAMVKLDPEGYHFQDAQWVTALSGAAGTGLYWWWHNYVEPLNLYRHYRPLSLFMKDEDLAARRWSDGGAVAAQSAGELESVWVGGGRSRTAVDSRSAGIPDRGRQGGAGPRAVRRESERDGTSRWRVRHRLVGHDARGGCPEGLGPSASVQPFRLRVGTEAARILAEHRGEGDQEGVTMTSRFISMCAGATLLAAGLSAQSPKLDFLTGQVDGRALPEMLPSYLKQQVRAHRLTVAGRR